MRTLGTRGDRGASLGAAVLDLLPMALLALDAGVEQARLPVLAGLGLGTVLAARIDRRRFSAWAAALPVAVSLTWGLVRLPPDATDGSSCASPLAPFATYRVVEAVIVLGAVAGLAAILGGGGEELGLRRPRLRSASVGIAAFALSGPLGVLLGPALAEPFFGHIALATQDPAALVPALVFGLSNGVMEEVVYRGSLRAWTGRVTGPIPAIVGQAIVFGIAHTGPDFTGPPLPVAAAMMAGGLIAGVIAWRTGSLFFPIAIHVGFDIPLFYGNACRIP
jgi:membrane protease YdiL (CAAX protease family)